MTTNLPPLLFIKKTIFGLLLIFSSFYSFGQVQNPSITIVIDPGHGGKDGGASGAVSIEKNIVLEVALRLKRIVESQIKDAKVIVTRSKDEFIPLYERIGLANKLKADLFISLHCNSMPYNLKGRALIHGTETFVSGFGRLDEQDVAIRENASVLLEQNYKDNYDGFDPNDPESAIVFSLMKNAYRTKSIELASLLQDEYTANGRLSRGVKEQSLAVLARAGMPAVLTEIGFLSNPQEEKYLNSKSGQEEIAENISNAIKKFSNSLINL